MYKYIFILSFFLSLNSQAQTLNIEIEKTPKPESIEITLEKQKEQENTSSNVEAPATDDALTKLLKEITTQKPLPKVRAVEPNDPLAAALQRAVMGQTEESAPSVQPPSSTQVVEEGPHSPPIRRGNSIEYTHVRYNGLWDLMEHDTQVPSTAEALLIDLYLNTSKYVQSERVDFFITKNGGTTVLGPLGRKFINNSGEEHYQITDPREERRKDSVISITVEKAVDRNGNDAIYDLDLLIFAHSSDRGSSGYFFKEVRVTVDWNIKRPITKIFKKITEFPLITINQYGREIPVENTDFELKLELATQKAILYDAKNNITRVYPITAGALDIRDRRIDPYLQNEFVKSMTLSVHSDENNPNGTYANFEDAGLVKRSVMPGRPNFESRTYPYYYSGRPFIGLIDFKRTNKNNPSNYSSGYREIGIHYQIDDDSLKRGFESHGCIRHQDQDLYTLDAIINYGPKDFVPITVKMALNEFKDLDSVYKRNKHYNKIVYTATPDNNVKSVKCPNIRAPYTDIKRFSSGYHTVADESCLTKIKTDKSHLVDAVNYITNPSHAATPTPLIIQNLQHSPFMDSE